MPDTDPLGYHVMPGTMLLDLLKRAHGGEEPDLVYAEAWANADHDSPRQWSLPPSPGPEVTAVRDDDWAVWQRNPADGSWYEEGEDPGPLGVSWEELLSDFGPLTDATDEGQR